MTRDIPKFLPCGCSAHAPCPRARAIVDSRLSWTDARGGLRAHLVAVLSHYWRKKSLPRAPVWVTAPREIMRAKSIAQALAEVRAINAARLAAARAA